MLRVSYVLLRSWIFNRSATRTLTFWETLPLEEAAFWILRTREYGTRVVDVLLAYITKARKDKEKSSVFLHITVLDQAKPLGD